MRRALANLLYLCLGLPIALSALLLVSARPWALDRATYSRIVDDDRLYTILASPETTSGIEGTLEIALSPKSAPAGLPAAVKVDAKALAIAVQKNLPVGELKSTADAGIDDILAAVRRGTAPEALDVSALKAAVKARSAGLARDYVAALPKAEGSAAIAPGDLTHRSPSLPVKAQEAAVAGALRAAVDAQPDRVVPSGQHGTPRDIPIGILSREPDGLSQALLNRMSATMAAVSALLLAGLGALGGRGALDRLTRAGKYLLVPSVVVLVAGAALAIPGGLILQNLLLPPEAQRALSGEAGAQLRAYLASALGPIARSFFLTGLVGTSLGGVLASSKKFSPQKELE